MTDQPHVQLVWATPNAEALVTRMARVSAPANQDNLNTAPRLLRYLITHKHWSPFEMINMCVEIKTERDISAQILRHRSFSFQEFSTRYAVAQDALIPNLRRQDMKNRQNSIDDLPAELTAEFQRRIKSVFGECSKLYNDMLEAQVAKECARRVLPLATGSTLFMQGTVRSWIHYIALRTGTETQLEHRQIAEGCKAVFQQEFPVIAKAVFGEC